MDTSLPPQPVWPGYCADPFVIRTPRGYVMFGTSPVRGGDGLVFQTLRSDDLLRWREGGGALVPPSAPEADTEYWAPEVAATEGRFWMYYSTGHGDAGHRLRVAVADDPAGPYVDCGVELTADLAFAIDPSPFRDADGRWWLYFATDDLTGERPGTCLAVAPMAGPAGLAGPARVVLRPYADWQRFEADRLMYGARYDWHTLEGPHVVHRLGRYWLVYSGGNWQTPGYGLGIAVSDRPDGPWEVLGEAAVDLGMPGTHAGAGHASVVTDSAGDDHLVLHAWDTAAGVRQPFVIPVVWTDEGPRPRGG